MSEYKKSCEDELDWASVGQLHEATLQISKSCFEFKKICVGLIGAALAVLVKLTENNLDHSYFVISLLICFGFWIADFSAYYFQRKIRNTMNKKLCAIAERNAINNYSDDELEVSWINAAFNHSMALYFALATLVIVSWVAYVMKWIGA